jgi:threonine aldolase
VTTPLADLRSDTVTKPTAAMRRAMCEAEVGDDVYGEDPTVRKLEELVAELLGKDAALFVPSGTMANQIALKLLTLPGDEVIAGEGTHCAWYEAGAAAAIGGIQFCTAGSGGLFSADDVRRLVKPAQYYYPKTTAVVIENTHNRGGGRIFPQEQIENIARTAASLNLKMHLDGARLWHVGAATNTPIDILAAPFDTVSVCFSKGLGAPVGSALAIPAHRLGDARRLRRMFGGAMRQSGLLASGALYALDHHRDRLLEDHDKAREFARSMARAAGVCVDPAFIETNIVNVDLVDLDARAVAERAASRGVLLLATTPRTLRAVTHLDVSRDAVERAADVLCAIVDDLSTAGRP